MTPVELLKSLSGPAALSGAPFGADLIAFCREHLATFKAPRIVVFCELPKTSTGKIQKFELREIAKSL